MASLPWLIQTRFEFLEYSSNSSRKQIFRDILGKCSYFITKRVQSNINSSNTDGSFTMANSNSFLSPYKILPLAQENKYLGKFSYLIMTLYVVCTH